MVGVVIVVIFYIQLYYFFLLFGDKKSMKNCFSRGNSFIEVCIFVLVMR